MVTHIVGHRHDVNVNVASWYQRETERKIPVQHGCTQSCFRNHKCTFAPSKAPRDSCYLTNLSRSQDKGYKWLPNGRLMAPPVSDLAE